MRGPVNLNQLTEEQQKKVADKFWKAPCLLCDKPMAGYRKIPAGENVALVPLCEDCSGADQETIQLAMSFVNAQYQAMVTTR